MILTIRSTSSSGRFLQLLVNLPTADETAGLEANEYTSPLLEERRRWAQGKKGHKGPEAQRSGKDKWYSSWDSLVVTHLSSYCSDDLKLVYGRADGMLGFLVWGFYVRDPRFVELEE